MKKLAALIFWVFLVCDGAVAAPISILTVPTIADLEALGPAASQYPTVQVLGYYVAGDSGGGFFKWNSTSTATAEPCITFSVSGVSTGRYIRQLGSLMLSLPDCGVKADSGLVSPYNVVVTDNTAAVQAVFSAAATYSLGTVYCPSSAAKIGMLSTVNVPVGITLQGQNNSLNGTLGNEINPGSCWFLDTTAGIMFDTQTAVTSVCPQQQGPSFLDFTFETPNGSGIRINNPATAGFTDTCSSMTQGQSIVSGGTIRGLVFNSSSRSTTGISLSKVFNYTIRDNTSIFYDTQWQFAGSDNIDFQHNTMTAALVQELNLIGEGTFGNEFHAHQNTFNDLFTNASYNVNTSYNEVIIDDNYFEDAQFTGGTAAINIVSSGATIDTITNNFMGIDPSFTTYWLQEAGNFEVLNLSNNPDGGLAAPSNFNSGAGVPFMYSGSLREKIFGFGNPDGNSGIPFLTSDALTISSAAGLPPAISGSVLGSFTPSSPGTLGGTYGLTVKVNPAGCFVIPYAAGSASYVTFKIRPAVTATTDIWIYALASSATTTQTMFVSDGVGTQEQILTGSTTGTWYHPAGTQNDAVTDPTITVGNDDAAHGSITIQFCVVSLTKH